MTSIALGSLVDRGGRSRVAVVSPLVTFLALVTLVVSAARSLSAAPAPPKLTIERSASHACVDQDVALTAKRGDTPVAATWTYDPVLAGDLSDASGSVIAPVKGVTAKFRPTGLTKTVAMYGVVTVTATEGGETATA